MQVSLVRNDSNKPNVPVIAGASAVGGGATAAAVGFLNKLGKVENDTFTPSKSLSNAMYKMKTGAKEAETQKTFDGLKEAVKSAKATEAVAASEGVEAAEAVSQIDGIKKALTDAGKFDVKEVEALTDVDGALALVEKQGKVALEELADPKGFVNIVKQLGEEGADAADIIAKNEDIFKGLDIKLPEIKTKDDALNVVKEATEKFTKATKEAVTEVYASYFDKTGKLVKDAPDELAKTVKNLKLGAAAKWGVIVAAATAAVGMAAAYVMGKNKAEAPQEAPVVPAP